MKIIFNLTAAVLLLVTLAGCAGETAKADVAEQPETVVMDVTANRTEAVNPAEAPVESAGAVTAAEPAAEPPETEAENPAEAAGTPAAGVKFYDGYVFSKDGSPVHLGDEMTNVLATLGAEEDYYEAPSCAFDGTAKIYVYGGFETATYITGEGEPDRLYSITLFDDSVATAEGIYIGQSYGDMVAAYGEDYEEIPGSYLYTKDGAVLSFTAEDGVITVIQYYIEDIYG